MKKFNGRISPLVLAAIMAAQPVATPILNITAYASEIDVEAENSKNEFGGGIRR